MNQYKILERPGDGLLVTWHPEFKRQLWSLSKLTKKKIGQPCAICRAKLDKQGYRPFTNLSNRMRRICPNH